jgi:hypothetical protein
MPQDRSITCEISMLGKTAFLAIARWKGRRRMDDVAGTSFEAKDAKEDWSLPTE